ncbi:MAG: LLM class flavin-dependent oxidoreductase [Chloroflexi bacterium]|nr:LLM class flavin-dependent oxidoreductase [Chloroflexota bacterium]
MALTLGVVDQSPIRQGGTARDALDETRALAAACDRLGYHRYWLAEHHGTGGLASASPEVLIPLLARETRHLRVGSGGVMLTHYAALKVAEQFRLLTELFPGRIDLGVGRAPGSDLRTAHALSPLGRHAAVDRYPEQLAELVSLLEGDYPPGHPLAGVRVTPQPARDASGALAPGALPEVWILGSSTESAAIAAEQGLAYSYAQFINPVAELGERAARLYRERFRPSRRLPEPRLSVAVTALCAESEERAQLLSWSRFCWRFRRSRGAGRGGVPPAEEAIAFGYTPAELDYVEYARSRSAIGSPRQVREQLESFSREYGTEELLLVTITHDFSDRLRSYELVAEACGLAAPAADPR